MRSDGRWMRSDGRWMRSGARVDEETRERVDGYVQETLLGEDPALAATTRSSAAAALPPIAVSAPQGRMLTLLAKVHGARRVLELGTLGGYSTICLARALRRDGPRPTCGEPKTHREQVRAAGGDRALRATCDRRSARRAHALRRDSARSAFARALTRAAATACVSAWRS